MNEINMQCCPMSAADIEKRLENDDFYYMPEELWPEDATVVRREPCYLWYRHSEWKPTKAVNESNKELLDRCIEHYKKKHPEIDDPKKVDDFWINCVDDCIVGNAVANRDYVFDGDNVGYAQFGQLLKQYDVVIQETIGGRICKPFLVYDIEYRYAYKASYKMDDYATEQLKDLKERLKNAQEVEQNAKRTNSVYSKDDRDEYHKAFRAYEDKHLELIKQGHAIYKVESDGIEYRMNMRWVEHKDGKSILHKGNY